MDRLVSMAVFKRGLAQLARVCLGRAPPARNRPSLRAFRTRDLKVILQLDHACAAMRRTWDL
jgi:hypothetical protein